jgi:hypothetical protein
VAQGLKNQSTRRVQPPLTGQAWLHHRGEAQGMECLLQDLGGVLHLAHRADEPALAVIAH